jgi:hypothetical protein
VKAVPGTFDETFTVSSPPSPGVGLDMLAAQLPEGDVAGGADVGRVVRGCAGRADCGDVAGGPVVGGTAVDGGSEVAALPVEVVSTRPVAVALELDSFSFVVDVVRKAPAVTFVCLVEPVAEPTVPITMMAAVTHDTSCTQVGRTRKRRHTQAARSLMGDPHRPPDDPAGRQHRTV